MDLLLKLLIKFKLINKFNLLRNKKLNNKNVLIPILGGTGSVNLLQYEKWMTQILEILSSSINQGIFLDIGVNVGQTLIKVKSYFGKEVKYIGFEPNPLCVHYVNSLCKVNRWKDIQLYPIALFNKTDILTLHSYYKQDTDASASVVVNFRPDQKVESTQHVPGFNFSILEKNIETKNIRIIKIDVEGAESQIVQTLEPLLTENEIVLLMEILPTYNENRSDRIERQNLISDVLTRSNMQLYRIRKANTQLQGLQVLPNNYIEIHSEIEKSDYIAFSKFNKGIILNFNEID